jgi:uncharacterized membrane protein
MRRAVKEALMQSKVKLFGHPVHQMLVPIPLGLFVAAVLFDVIAIARDSVGLTNVAHWNILAGIIFALVAAVFGALDLYPVPRQTRAFRVGVLHGVGNIVMTLLFVTAALLRWRTEMHRPSGISFAIEVIAIGLAFVTAWLGGELVDRLGVGVDDNAGLDAPSSLHDRRPQPR